MVNSRSGKVLALSIGQGLASIGGIVLSMIASRLLIKDDYATMKQTLLAYNFVAPLLMLGIPSALYYFLPRTRDRKKGIVLDVFLLIFGLSVIFSLFLILGGAKLLAMRFNNPELEITLRWMIFYPIYVMPAGILSSILVTQNKTIVLTVYNVFSRLSLTLLAIWGIYYTKDYTGPLFVQIFVPILFFPIIIWLSFKYIPGKFSKPSVPHMIKIIKFAAPLGVATMLGSIMLQLDKVIVSLMCTPEEFANYVNGAFELPFIGIITGSIATIILADMSTLIANNNKREAIELFKKASVSAASLLFPIMIFLLFNAKNFIITLYSEKYIDSITPFIIYLFILPLRTVMYGSAFMAIGKSKIILIRSLFDLLVNLVLSIIFVNLFGYLGAAFSTIITLYLWTWPYNIFYISKEFEIPIKYVLPIKKMLTILVISILFIPITLVALLCENTFIKLLISATAYFPIVFYMLHLKKLIFVPNFIQRFIPNFLKK